jgi:hypothetical protein
MRAWHLVAPIAERHPRLLAWLAEGQVTWYWNVFGTLIAILRLIRGLRWVVWHFLFEPVARSAPWRTELLESILQDQRRKINEQSNSAARLSTALTITPVPGLSAVTDVATITQNAACAEVREKIETMSSGCIGVSGLRGSGKSTLIRDFCCHRYGTPTWPPADTPLLPGLRLMIEVPLPHDAREFLVHLYTCLCKAVLADVRLNAGSSGRHILLGLVTRSVRPTTLFRVLSSITLLILVFALAWRAATDRWWVLSLPQQAWDAVGAAAAVIAAGAVIGWRTRQALIEAREVITLATDAQARLERLHFQRTDTRSLAGTVGGSRGVGMNLTSSRALTQQMMTLPELVDDYRDFAERTVAALQQATSSASKKTEVRLVIGIDQMDQIDNAQHANKFLNELSAVFGTPHCVYLIAISPGALATTSRRKVPLKTASSGIFDEMIWIEPLGLSEARDLLNRRVIGLPPAFIALCYVLSGGLPRDLLRVARAIFTTNSDRAQTTLELAEATRSVIADEIRALKHRSMILAASLGTPARPDLLGLLSRENWPSICLKNPGSPGSPQPIEIQTILGDISRLWAGAAKQQAANPGFSPGLGSVRRA